ncbi:hypothetical protein [Vibrio sp. S234-5]|uniref:hypothetical protein n=1 Tax=Vibrio sp. S234-5 TaxID=1616781 RepID=UPI0005EF6B7A|nr:hypothetical protein [Vibrio sp. S234-5]KJR21509.1 hypothetical protein UF06_19185 [Vibrio sp. S234-5]
MALDTRGFVDGALRGFETGNRYYEQKQVMSLRDAEEQRRQQAFEQQAKLSDLNLQKANLDVERGELETDFMFGTKGEDGARSGGYKQTKAAQEKENHDQNKTLNDLRITNEKEKNDALKRQAEEQKRAIFIQNNQDKIDLAWEASASGNEDESFYDHPMIKGTSYDIRHMSSPDIQDAAAVIERKMQTGAGIRDFLNDNEVISAMATLYQRNADKAVGTRSADGRIIERAKVGGINLAQDINPDIPGDQPGVVLSLDVDYGDGQWVRVPVTENRTGLPDDAVRIIPVDYAMKDLIGQIKQAKKASYAKAYQKRYANKGKDKSSAEIDKQWRTARTELEKDRTEALNQLNGAAPEQIEALNDLYNKRGTAIDQIYGKLGGESGGANNQAMNAASQWAGNDPQKQQFINELNPKDIANVSPELLESEFQRAVKMREAAEKERTYQMLLTKLKDETNYAKAKQEVEQAGLTPDQQRSILGQIRDNQYDAATPDFLKEIPEKVSQGLSDLADGLKPIQPQTLRNIPRPF